MCEVCANIENLTTYRVNQYDPTRTLTLRDTFVRESNRRFEELARVVKKAVDEDDCFGLKITSPQTFQLQSPGKNAFAFGITERKIKEFLKWLEQQMDKGVLTVVELEQAGEAIFPLWTNKYISMAYKRGVQRAREKMIKAGMNIPSIDASGGIGYAMSPIHIQRAGLLYIRTYSELKGITSQMEQIIARILTQGMIDGENPLKLARRLVSAINGAGIGDLGMYDKFGRFIPAKRRAEMMARTEIIRAHHLGAIQEYRNFGVLGVHVVAELRTAGDAKVCVECSSLEGRQFSLDEAEGIIPVHPNCRCCTIPVIKRVDRVRAN